MKATHTLKGKLALLVGSSALGAGALVVALGGGAGSTAVAQEPGATATPSPMATTSPTGTMSPTGTPSATQTPASDSMSYEEFLADELSITVEELRSAQNSARDRYFDQLAEQGDITAEQAASLKATSPGQIVTGLMSEIQGSGSLTEAMVSAMTRIFDIDRDTLNQAIEDGKSLNDIAAENNVTEDQLRSRLRTTVESIIADAQMVGILTQEQADSVRSSLDEKINEIMGKDLSQIVPDHGGSGTGSDTQ